MQGNVLVVDCTNSLLHSGKRLVAAIELEDICVMETADAILISKRGQTQRVHEVVEQLNLSHAREHVVHLVVPGTPAVVRENETIAVTKNESTYISVGARHKLENRGEVPVHLIEVQVGE